MTKAIFHLIRDNYRGERTLGKLMDHEGNFYCYVLEDTVRGYGIKDKARTAIPATQNDDLFFVRVMDSGKYNRVTTIFTELVGAVPVLDYGGVKFSYIRCHGGNDEKDTEGCLLVNKNRDVNNMLANGSLRHELTATVDRLTAEGYDVRLRITNQPQTA